MGTRLHNLTKWAVLAPGDVLALAPGEARRMRFEFNSVAAARVDLRIADAMVFLAVVNGHDWVEFTVPASDVESALVVTSDDDVFYFTDVGDSVTVESYKPTMTKIAKRRARNRDLEMMQYLQEQKINARMARMEAEMRARYGAPLEVEPEAEAKPDDGSTEAPAGGAGAPKKPAGGGAKPEAAAEGAPVAGAGASGA